MCVLTGCKVPTTYTNNLAHYGLSAQVMCDDHYTKLRQLLGNVYNGLSNPLLDDFVRLKLLMMDKPKVEAYLATLDQNMPGLDPHSPNGPRIGKVLGRYEKRCYFPDFVIVPLGFIAHDFDNLGRSGFLAMKDVGAGIGHGKYTHRLQWHVAMRAITNQFQSAHGHWNHSPLELFLTSMGISGNIDARPVFDHQSTNLFGFIFDLSANGAGSYSWPDELFNEMRDTTKYPHIGRSASKNWLKRQQEDILFRNAMNQYTNEKIRLFNAQQKLFNARQTRNNASGPMKWIGNRNVGIAKQELNAIATPVKPLSPSEQMEQKMRQHNAWSSMGQIPNANPFQLPNHNPAPIDFGDAILVPHGTPMPGPHDIQVALASSRNQLNPAQALPIGQSGHP